MMVMLKIETEHTRQACIPYVRVGKLITGNGNSFSKFEWGYAMTTINCIQQSPVVFQNNKSVTVYKQQAVFTLYLWMKQLKSGDID